MEDSRLRAKVIEIFYLTYDVHKLLLPCMTSIWQDRLTRHFLQQWALGPTWPWLRWKPWGRTNHTHSFRTHFTGTSKRGAAGNKGWKQLELKSKTFLKKQKKKLDSKSLDSVCQYVRQCAAFCVCTAEMKWDTLPAERTRRRDKRDRERETETETETERETSFHGATIKHKVTDPMKRMSECHLLSWICVFHVKTINQDGTCRR